MNQEMDPALLISVVILVVLIVYILWWYGVRKTSAGERAADEVSFTSPEYRDNLTLIDGIGATLEAKLNGLGITSFKQIAEFDQNDIERVNNELDFKGRIQREGWVAQARKLVEGASRTGSEQPVATVTRGKKKTKVTKKKTAGKKAATKNTTLGKTAKKARKSAGRSTKRGS